MRITFVGLSVTSSWGNGHATNYRALMRALADRGHDVAFLERDVPWYAEHRDLPEPPWGHTALYGSLDELRERHAATVRDADLVIVGSYVPEGVAVGHWVCDTAAGATAFYDIDTPVTLAKLAAGDTEYLDGELLTRYHRYLSFTGGPTLDRLAALGAQHPTAFHCLVDADAYVPLDVPLRWDLGYLGTYSPDRQPALERLLLAPARANPDLRCVVAGPRYPDDIDWPPNVERLDHVPPAEHPAFYAAQRVTVNVTRADMVAAGWSPSVRLFEAAACAVPVLSDAWDGLDAFFTPGDEILVEDVAAALALTRDARAAMGAAARARVLAGHTAAHRAAQLERYAQVPAAG